MTSFSGFWCIKQQNQTVKYVVSRRVEGWFDAGGAKRSMEG